MRNQTPTESERLPRGWENICGYAYIGCKVAKKSINYFTKECAVKGESCGYKCWLDLQGQLNEIFKIL